MKDEANIRVDVGTSGQITTNVEPKSKLEVIIGDAAKMDCTKAINYIKSGAAEIEQAVQEGIEDFNENAVSKTDDFNTNAVNKTNAFNDNAEVKTGDFNDNATDKTNAFNQNATDKTGDFNTNAVNKTKDFNDNYTAKKQIIDDAVTDAQGYATSASNSADLAKQWAIGDPTEPTGNSAKYWANQASSELSGLTSRVTTIEGKIPAEASSSNQLADKSYVNSADNGLQSQIDAIVASSDVFDIVGTYAELQAYDISTVPVNDIIKVLVDSTHDNAATYYRCVETDDVKSWSYIGTEAAYYTKAQSDSRFASASDVSAIQANYVTTNTAQTISESKTFSKEIFATLASYSAINAASNANPYKKIGECILTGTYQTVIVPFMYSRTHQTTSSGSYLGKIILRTEGTAGTLNQNMTGVIISEVPDFIDTGDLGFYVVYKDNTPETNKVTCQIWVYVKNTYQGVNIMPLRQGTGGGNYSTTNITWGNNLVEASELPSDYTAIIQKKAVMYNVTQSTTDNSRRVATTAYVKNNLANYVTTNTAQTITGAKTFTSYPISQFESSNTEASYINGFVMKDTNLNISALPSYNKVSYIAMKDSADRNFGFTEYSYRTNGVSRTTITARTRNTDNNANVDCSLVLESAKNGTVKITAPTPTDDNTTSTQIDTVGARNTKLQDYATTAYVDSVAGVVHIVETGHNGTEWYRVWSDGFCEQGGTVGTGTTSGYPSYTITLTKEYADTNFNVQVTGRYTSDTNNGTNYCSARTTNSITIRSVGYGSDWVTRGYIS